MAKRDLQLRGGKRPQLIKPRRDRFTAAKQDKFFEVLTATCNVAAACRAAKVSRSTVDRHRQQSAAFRARWAAAVREAYAALELMLIERSMNGTVKTVTKADGSKETIHEYPNALALQLLRLHRATAAEAEAEHEEEDVEEVRRRLDRRLERLRIRLDREEAEDARKAAQGGAE